MENYPPLEPMEELKNNFILGRYKVSRIANINLNTEIYLFSHLTDKIKKNLFLKSFDSLEEAFFQALKVQGEKAKVLVID